MDINKYKENLTNYFRRYVAQKPARQLVRNAENKISADNYFLPYRDAIIDFVHTEIKAKRKKAIDYMYDLCNKYQEQGEENFKNDVKYYFASKYSASQYLPSDTEDGKKSSSKIVLKYLDYINKPPNGMGGPINNFEHLKGACNRYLISQGTNENPTILILNATSTIAIDSSRSTDFITYIQSDRFLRAEKQLIKGYRLLIKDGERVAVLQELLNANISLLEAFNISLSDILAQMKLSITNFLLINKAKYIRLKLTKI
jgi:ATP-dependent DNA helicase RecQ